MHSWPEPLPSRTYKLLCKVNELLKAATRIQAGAGKLPWQRRRSSDTQPRNTRHTHTAHLNINVFIARRTRTWEGKGKRRGRSLRNGCTRHVGHSNFNTIVTLNKIFSFFGAKFRFFFQQISASTPCHFTLGFKSAAELWFLL